jgi:hypothetical protein
VLSRHRLAREFTNANIGCYSVQSDALEEAKRLKRLWGVERSMYRVRLPARALTVDIGQVITLEHARYRMQSGKQASVLGHALIGQEVELTVLM